MSVIKWWHERVFCMCDVVCEIGGGVMLCVKVSVMVWMVV